MKCNVLIDWLTFSVKGVNDPCRVITWYLGLDASLFQDPGYGLLGYDHVLAFNNIVVCYDPRENDHFKEMGVCVSMSGNGCRTFENMSKLNLEGNTDKQGTVNTAFPALFQLIACNDCNVSRVDLACDDHDGALDMDDIIEKVKANEINSRLKKRSVLFSFDGTDPTGATVYLGAPSSDFRVRIYDKAKEQGDLKGHWVRVELVMKGGNANAFVYNFVNCKTIGALATGIINDKFSFIEQDDSNITRCSVTGWWLEFLGSLESVHLLTREVMQHSIEEVEAWVTHQLAPSLGLLFQAKGLFCLTEIAKEGIRRLSNKQRVILEDYRSTRKVVSV